MNLNTVYVVHTYCTTAVSFLINFFLIYLIKTKTPSTMKTYSNVLLQTSSIDLFITFATCFTMMQGETSENKVFIRPAAPWIPSSGYYPCFGLWLYLISLATVYWSMCVQPLFRYFRIVRNTTLTPTKTWIIHFGMIFGGAALSFHYSFAYCRNEGSTFNYILKNISPWKFEESLESFRSLNLLTLDLCIYLASLITITAFCNTIFFYCTYKVVKSLKASSSKYSKQTLKMHTEFNRKSLYQMIFPIISFIVLVITCGIVHFKFIENSGILLFSLMFFQYITILNPIITILTIQNYRNFFSKKKSNVKSISTTVSKITRYQERPQIA